MKQVCFPVDINPLIFYLREKQQVVRILLQAPHESFIHKNVTKHAWDRAHCFASASEKAILSN